MNRFFISSDADLDLDQILEYLDTLPTGPRATIGDGIEAMLYSIAALPYLGAIHSESSRLIGQEVRSRLMSPYRIFYRFSDAVPEIIAVLHTARDISTIMAERLQ